MLGSKMKQRISSACVFLAVFGLLFLATSPRNLIFTQHVVTRKTSIKRKAPEIFKRISEDCDLPQAQSPQERLFPSFLTSFPGLWDKLQTDLAEALAGIVTSDDTFSNGHHNVVAVKTYYPCPSGRIFHGAEEIDKVIVFIRHPMESLVSYYDALNEERFDTDSAKRASLNQWISWRDSSFDRELDTWKKHFTYWMDHYVPPNRLVIPYHQLLSRRYGPDLAMKIAEFLRRGNDASVNFHPERIPCIWQKVVINGQRSLNSDERKLRRRLQLVDDTSNMTGQKVPELKPIVTSQAQSKQYHDEIMSPVDQHPKNAGGARPGHIQEEKVQKNELKSPRQPIMVTLQQQQQQPQAQLEGIIKQFVQLRHEVDVPQRQYPSVSLTHQGELMASGSIDHRHGSVAASVSLSFDEKESSIRPERATPLADEPISEHRQLQTQTLLGDMPNADSSSKVTPRDPTVSPEIVPGKEENEADAIFEVERREEPKNRSDRESDDVDTLAETFNADFRPYTTKQQKEVVIVLTQLLEIYRDDLVLAPVLVEYIDQTTKEFEESAIVGAQRKD